MQYWNMQVNNNFRNRSRHKYTSVQFSSIAQSCPILCNPMNRSSPGLPVHHHLPEFTQTCPSSWWCHPAISSSVVPFSSCPWSFPASGSFPMSQLFAWGGQSTGVSALASFLPKKSQAFSNQLILTSCSWLVKKKKVNFLGLLHDASITFPK